MSNDFIILLVHPGKVLKDEIEARNITAGALALKLMVHPNKITEIIRGNRAISPETALRLARYFKTSAQFWMNLQTNYDLAKARILNGEQINKEISPAHEEMRSGTINLNDI